jgi:hypothetical protein
MTRIRSLNRSFLFLDPRIDVVSLETPASSHLESRKIPPLCQAIYQIFHQPAAALQPCEPSTQECLPSPISSEPKQNIGHRRSNPRNECQNVHGTGGSQQPCGAGFRTRAPAELPTFCSLNQPSSDRPPRIERPARPPPRSCPRGRMAGTAPSPSRSPRAIWRGRISARAAAVSGRGGRCSAPAR